jgi:hypothetical protein
VAMPDKTSKRDVLTTYCAQSTFTGITEKSAPILAEITIRKSQKLSTLTIKKLRLWSEWLLNQLSLSRLKHWLPRGQSYPEVVQGTAQFHQRITDARFPQAEPIFHDATALDTTMDMLDPQPTLVEDLVGPLLLSCQFAGMRISTFRSVKARKPRSCNNQLPTGKGEGVASAIRLAWTRPP